MRKLKPKKKSKKKTDDAVEKEEGGIDPIPVFGGVLIGHNTQANECGKIALGSVLGGPVLLIAGLKLGMFAAIGGGIMGYTTGKMFSDYG